MRSFVIINPSRIGDIALSFADIGKSCPVREFFTSQMCLLALFAKIKFSRKFANLQLPIISPVKSLVTLNWNLVTCDS